MRKDTKEEQDYDITESTETINIAEVGGKFEIILNVKKINTSKTIDKHPIDR